MPKFNYIKLFIDSYFNYVFNLNNINSSIFCVSNENLNAKFLARFVARRLQQGFSIKQVMRPIIKDLLVTNKLSTIGNFTKNNNLNKIKLLFKKSLNLYVYLFKSIFIFKGDFLNT
jgi:hypothetical protein